MTRWLILGGSGFVGRTLCRTLVQQASAHGEALSLRVPTRRLAHAQALRPLPQVDVLQADVHDDAALDTLLADCDGVVNLIAILHGSEASFEAAHVRWPTRLAAACLRTGVKRLVHVSALGVSLQAPSRYLRSKARGEAALQAAAQNSGLELTVLRPSVIFGAEDRFLNLFAQLQALAPVVPLAGATAQFQPVWVGDVARAIAHCLHQPATIGQIIECAGPEVKTLAELVRLAGSASGHPRPVLPLPAALAQLQAGLMECLPGEPLMSRDNVASMQVPNIASGQLPGLAALGIPPTPLAAIVPDMLGAGQRCARLDAWRTRHR